MPDVVRALVREEEAQGRRHQRADLVEAPWTRGPQERLQLGEGEFDRIEIGTVRWKKTELRAGLLDRRAHVGLLVDRQVVHDDHIPPTQGGDQDLLDVGAEGHRVDRAVEHGRRAQLRGAQPGDHGVSLPVATRRVIRRARATRTAGVPPEQIGGDARFVDKDKPGGVVERLPLAPLPARGGDISATLFGGVYGFF
jgi:hypothetical protein